MVSTNYAGATAVIDPKGRVSTQLAPFTSGMLSASVQGYRGATPYILLGNASVLILAFGTLGAAWFLRRKYRRNAPGLIKTR